MTISNILGSQLLPYSSLHQVTIPIAKTPDLQLQKSAVILKVELVKAQPKEGTRTNVQGSAFIFINFKQAARFGHVAWGFAIDAEKDSYYFGSTDHLYHHKWWDLPGWVRYAHVKPQLNIDWWSATGSKESMFKTMRAGHHLRYHACKEVTVTNASVAEAIERAESLLGGGWSLLSNNCVHQTYDVLSTYGADLPKPAHPLTNRIPRGWFAAVPGTYNLLTADFVQP